MKIRSFELKLIFSYVFVILFSLGFIAFFLDKNLEENSLQEIKSSLINQAYLVESQIPKENLKNENTPALEGRVSALSAKIKARLTIVNNKGRVLAESEKSEVDILKMPSHADRPEIKTALTGVTGEEIRYSSTLKIDMLYIALPIHDNNEIIGVVRLALPLANVQETLSTVRKAIFLSLFFTLGLAFVLGSLLTKGTIKPINKIIHISRKFSSGDFSHKILLDSKDEIGELADTLNMMADNLEDKIKKVEIKNQQLKAILESMVEGIIVTDKSGHIISLNPAVKKIFNISGQDTEGKLILEIIRNNDIADIINYVLTNGRFKSCELSLVWPVQKIFEINVAPIFDNDVITGCLAVIHDISEIRRLETVRQDFVANVSHELKTPLTSIKGFVETLLEGALDDKENNRNFLKIIQVHTERLNNLVNDLLSLSHLESKEIAFEKKNFNLRQQLEGIISQFKPQLKKMNIGIKNELSASISINADKDRIEQVFTNLIDNAIKFNKENGGIRIFAQEVDGKIKVFVEDSGIGVSEKDIPRIFERFYRVDKAHSRELGGTGLGLSIVKHIIELHSGSVGVESAEGFGSKFWFTLPK